MYIRIIYICGYACFYMSVHMVHLNAVYPQFRAAKINSQLPIAMHIHVGVQLKHRNTNTAL